MSPVVAHAFWPGSRWRSGPPMCIYAFRNAFGQWRARLSIHVSAMTDLHDRDDLAAVIDFVQDAVVARVSDKA